MLEDKNKLKKQLESCKFSYGLGIPDEHAKVRAAMGKVLIKGVPENFPTAWLQTSLMGMYLARSHMDRLDVIITVGSICTSLSTMIRPLPSAILGAWRHFFLAKKDFRKQDYCGVFFRILIFVIPVFGYAVAVAMCVVHFLGLGFCPQHNFEISSFSCTAWNFTTPYTDSIE